jgi:hypothetical protein
VRRTVVEDFAHDLARAARRPLAIKDYRGDLMAFATWFRGTKGAELIPGHMAPPDLRADTRRLMGPRGASPAA